MVKGHRKTPKRIRAEVSGTRPHPPTIMPTMTTVRTYVQPERQPRPVQVEK